ncbi:MAG: hypothetical protein J0L82_03885 [Deltaproteobacteria bacterium]|jgi:hypothetical protein|nr:hypothetical protein [Deltaproteobacteria bacterium]
MKQWLRGQTIKATVVELIEPNEILIRFGGGAEEPAAKLLRIRNETNRPLSSFSTDDAIGLRVIEILPLRFQFVEALNEQRRRGHIDVSI